MSIAEFFVNLGIKGDGKTLSALQGVDKGLSNMATSSLAAKAAIVGAFYALEQLFTSSGKFGVGMTNAKTLIGETSKSLQQYENTAQRLGIANGTMTQTLLKLKDAMVTLKFKGQAPEGMFWIQSVLGDFKESDIDKYIKSPEMLFQRLREYATKEKIPGLALDRLKSFIGDQDMIARMMQGHLTTDEISKSPFLSDATISRLEKTGMAWNKLGIDIQQAFRLFVSHNGKEIADDIDKLIKPASQLAEAFQRIAQNLHAFELIGKAMQGWADILGVLGKGWKSDPSNSWHGIPTSQFGRQGAELLSNAVHSSSGKSQAPVYTHAQIVNQITINGNADAKEVGSETYKAAKRALSDYMGSAYLATANNYDQSTGK